MTPSAISSVWISVLVHVWKPSKTKSVARGRQTTGGQISIVFYLYSPGGVTCLVLPTPYLLKIPPSSLAPLFGVSPFEFVEKLYCSWNQSLPGQWWRFDDSNLHRLWLIHPCDGRMDRQTELRWLRRAIAVPAVACNKTTGTYVY